MSMPRISLYLLIICMSADAAMAAFVPNVTTIAYWYMVYISSDAPVVPSVEIKPSSDTAAIAYSDEKINEIRSHVEERKLQILTNQMANPDPNYTGAKQEPLLYVFNRLNFALASLYMNQNIEQANQAVLDAINDIRKPENISMYFYGEAGLHWQGSVLGRIFLFFGKNGIFEERLTDTTQNVIKKALSDWATNDQNNKNYNADPKLTWVIIGSENHQIMGRSLLWMSAKILKDDPNYSNHIFDDGLNWSDRYKKITSSFELYISERGKRGLFAEYGSPGYTKHTLQCVYNLYDFSEEGTELKRLTKSLLDLWWADWACEQIDSFRGGSKLRVYRSGASYFLSPCQYGKYQSGRSFSWIYTGVGENASRNSCVMSAATSNYMIPDVVIDIALDVNGRGSYEIVSRRPSQMISDGTYKGSGHNDPPRYPLNYEHNGLVKYSYCTPTFIMGCDMSYKSYYTDRYAWGQNCWSGILFRGTPQDIIYFEATITDRNTVSSVSNHYWGVQNKNTMILQRNEHGWNIGDVRIWFGGNLKPVEEKGIVFLNNENAYAAIRVVFGGYKWDGKWLLLGDKDSPVIFEACESNKYADFDAFKKDVADNRLEIIGEASSKKKTNTVAFALRDDVLIYEGIQNSGKFTFYFKSDRVPEINNIPINYSPDFTFKSPFINQAPYGSGIVKISKDKREIVLDFNIK